jgi:hypothetical protein
MDDEFDSSNAQTNLIKWPFYVANALILGIVVSYLLNRPESPIDKWEVATCVFAVALSAMLFFVPYLVEYFISISVPEKKDSSSKDGLLEKTYLESKGLKENLSDFGVKLEKIPSIIEGIVKEACLKDDEGEDLAKLEGQIDSLRSNLEEILAKLTETPSAQPAEPDPRVDDMIASLNALEKTLDQISEDLGDQPRSDSTIAEPNKEEQDETEDDEGEEEEEEEEEEGDGGEEDEDDEEDEDEDEGEGEEEEENQTTEFDLGDQEGNLAKVDRILEETKSFDQTEEDSDVQEGGDEEDLDEEVEDEVKTAESSSVLKGVSQPATVVAKIIIGIGNKVHVRGEGPGLSWDEGVPMSFLEIGKWSWSPANKSVPLVVQLYKNDEEPDANGKIKLEPGENVEISPDFAS